MIRKANMNTFEGVCRSAAIVAALVMGLGLAGCRGDQSDAPPRQILPDMDDQPKYKSQAQSEFFEDQRTMREPAPGTVAWGRQPHAGEIRGTLLNSGAGVSVDFADRDVFLKDDPRVYTGRVSWSPEADTVSRIPIEVDRELLELGRRMYNIICINCHGGTGAGDGMVGRRWAAPLPTFHDPKYLHGGEKGDDGHIFWTIRNGVPNPAGGRPNMPAYASKVNEREAWAIVAYIRALQTSQKAPVRNEYLDELPTVEAAPPADASVQADIGEEEDAL